MGDRYPGYDVLSKRHSPSWNDQTRRVIDQRLAIDPDAHRFLNELEWRTLKAICSRIIPQPTARERPAPLAAMIDERLVKGASDGYRNASLPPLREAWRRGIAALEAEAQTRHGRGFAELEGAAQDGLLTAAQRGLAAHPAWDGMPPDLFFADRLLFDIVSAYYAHPHAWNEIGFGGPADPRGYVRLAFDRRDPWEAAEARSGNEASARRENAHVGRR
ncbi:MAG TPA: gluconate 2-dehydrogenase subunit 3 family protein [Caulobacteraceae bacterium]|nr:gluconate 2-dehydrogenase subunit 3 family protein [Caulobacteraceae bacterium]